MTSPHCSRPTTFPLIRNRPAYCLAPWASLAASAEPTQHVVSSLAGVRCLEVGDIGCACIKRQIMNVVWTTGRRIAHLHPYLAPLHAVRLGAAGRRQLVNE